MPPVQRVGLEGLWYSPSWAYKRNGQEKSLCTECPSEFGQAKKKKHVWLSDNIAMADLSFKQSYQWREWFQASSFMGAHVWLLTCTMLAVFTDSFSLFVMLDGLSLRGSLEVVAGLIVLPGVPFAFAGCDNSYFVGSYASILALELDPLGASFVIDTPPFLRAPPAPVLGSITSPNPVGEQRQREAFTSTYQLFQGVYARTLAIWNVLGGSQFPTANLNTICRMHRTRTLRLRKRRFPKPFLQVANHVQMSKASTAIGDMDLYNKLLEMVFHYMCTCLARTGCQSLTGPSGS